ncbi:MAG TPA: glycosyltransferase, partial [Acidimicrobiales bacterium]|nr:glycosyltransferase [Acidimicrobiales bacterium]
ELATRVPLDPALVDGWAHRPQGGFGPGERRSRPRGPGAWDDAREAAASAKRVLVVDPYMPVYDRASGSLRLFTLLRCLREAGHAVEFLPSTGGDRRYARALGRFGVRCYGAPIESFDGRSQEEFRRYFPLVVDLLRDARPDAVILSPWTMGELLVDEVRAGAPEALIVLDTNDVHYRRLERELEVTGSSGTGAQEVAEAKRRELAVYAKVDRVVCVTDDDADAVRAALPGTQVVVVPNAHGLADPGPGFDERAGAVFVGNFNHPPNADAVAWWRDAIAPDLERRLPGTVLTVVGNDPAGVAAAMACEGIEVTGAVPSTLPALHRARVSVAPLRYGAGMKGKVGEALAAGLPVVLTQMAAEGMGLVHEQHALIADTAQEFAAAVARLHTDRELWERLREGGRIHLESHFGVDRMRAELPGLLAPATRGAGPNRQARRQARRSAPTAARPTTPASAASAASGAPRRGALRSAPEGGFELAAERPVGTTDGRPTVALAMNTRNEAAKIADALASCAGADEIVVADMESDDDTVAIASAHGARILELPNAGFCEPGRQPLIDAVESEWIVLLDADERLCEGGLDRLRALAAVTGPEVSAYLIPEVTLLGDTRIDGTGWGTHIELHHRFFRRSDVTWPSEIHGVPTFSGHVARLPEDAGIEILHLNFDDLTHAYDKFNRYSTVEAREVVDAGKPASWLTGFDDAVPEFVRRYEPDVDGGVSLAMSFGLLFYRMGVHLKAMEAGGTLRDAPMPAAASLARAWQAFRATLEVEETARARSRVGELLSGGDAPAAVACLQEALDLWGATPELLVEAAVLSANVGAFADAVRFCDQVLAADPEHTEANVTRLGIAVAAGERPPVTTVVVGAGTPPLPGAVVVKLRGEPGDGDITAPLDALPFAPGTLSHLRVPRWALLSWPPAARAGLLDSLQALVATEGTVELFDEERIGAGVDAG